MSVGEMNLTRREETKDVDFGILRLTLLNCGGGAEKPRSRIVMTLGVEILSGAGNPFPVVPDLANISGNIGLQNARRRDNKPLYLGRAI